MGAPSDVVDQLREHEQEGTTFEIHEDNQDTVAAFLALQTQWRIIAGMAMAYQGLDYGSIPAVLNMIGIPRADRARVFAELRIMEIAALPVLNAKQDDA